MAGRRNTVDDAICASNPMRRTVGPELNGYRIIDPVNSAPEVVLAPLLDTFQINFLQLRHCISPFRLEGGQQGRPVGHPDFPSGDLRARTRAAMLSNIVLVAENTGSYRLTICAASSSTAFLEGHEHAPGVGHPLGSPPGCTGEGAGASARAARAKYLILRPSQQTSH